jgi:hypothetical protein
MTEKSAVMCFIMCTVHQMLLNVTEARRNIHGRMMFIANKLMDLPVEFLHHLSNY